MNLFALLSFGSTFSITYGILNVICAIKTVTKPRSMNFTKRSIIESPVTISALRSGIFVAPRKIVLFLFFIVLIPIAAIVPMIVAIRAAARVIWIVVQKAFMIVSLWKHLLYHLRVNPPQLTFVFELLKDRAISTAIGRYRKTKVRMR